MRKFVRIRNQQQLKELDARKQRRDARLAEKDSGLTVPQKTDYGIARIGGGVYTPQELREMRRH